MWHNKINHIYVEFSDNRMVKILENETDNKANHFTGKTLSGDKKPRPGPLIRLYQVEDENKSE